MDPNKKGAGRQPGSEENKTLDEFYQTSGMGGSHNPSIDSDQSDESERRKGEAATVAEGAKAAPFDPSSFRIDQSFSIAEEKSASKAPPVQRPAKWCFFRVRDDAAYQLPVAVIEYGPKKQNFLVRPDLISELRDEIVAKLLYTTIDRSNQTAIWPVRLPSPDGRLDDWNQSAHEAAELAKKRWVRVVSNTALGAYTIIVARETLPEPIWPDDSFAALLDHAFRGAIIDSLDHEIVRRLRGQS